MRKGTLVDDRFEIGDVAGAGGMGTVYRAIDRETQELVALKVLHDGADLERFEREARILEDLRHAGIVRHVAHGRHDAAAYIAMEWLEGTPLSQRLREDTLSVSESVDLVCRVAEALDEPHRRGVVHRDLKPSNVFLVEGDITRPKILDFGIAHGPAEERLTQTGTTLGTPGYMAPEQARGEMPVRPAADVFSLGCILYRCVAGRPAFDGRDSVDVLLKVVLEDPPALSTLCPQVEPSVEALVKCMLAKPASERPPDAAALVDALANLAANASKRISSRRPPPLAITANEQRVVSLLVARHADAKADITMSRAIARSTRAIASAGGGVHDVLVDGSIVVAFSGAEAPADQAARAADVARRVLVELGDARVVLATGRGTFAEGRANGEVIERATDMLRSAELGEIVVDEATAGLLDVRFQQATRAREGGFAALCESATARLDPRRVLGQVVPLFGRARELAALEGLFDECRGDSRSRLALVVGPPGIGKTRLLGELVSRLSDASPDVVVWASRGDSVSPGSAFSLVASMVARAAGALDGEPLAERRAKLTRFARELPAERRGLTAQFLGELIGARFDAAESVELAAARRDSILMGDQIVRAVVDVLDHACAAGPLLVAVDDLQWGDAPSANVLERALRQLAHRPLFVVAMGRPEVEAAFPGLCKLEGSLEVRLGGLAPRPSEALARALLAGSSASRPGADVAARLAARAQGHPLVLEELARAHAAGRSEEDLPETALALVQARLEQLPADTRRTLRAASVFGQRFWPGGVLELLGTAEHAGWTAGEPASTRGRAVAALVERELAVRSDAPRFDGQEELAFVSPLVREAAYAMLTPQDLVLGHRLAAGWLTRAGEKDARVLGVHHELGGEGAQAAECFHAAALDAARGNDFASALELAARARAAGVGPDAVTQEPGRVARLGVLEAEAHRWLGDIEAACQAARGAKAVAVVGSAAWFDATGEEVLCLGRLGREDDAAGAALSLLAMAEDGTDEAARAFAIAGSRAAVACMAQYGAVELADALVARCEAASARLADPTVSGRAAYARARKALARGDLGVYLPSCREAVAHMTRAGDVRLACNWRVELGYAYLEHDALDAAEAELDLAHEAAARMGILHLEGYAAHNLGAVAMRRGDLPKAIERFDRAIAIAHETRSARLLGGTLGRRAAALLALGRRDEARASAEEAVPMSDDGKVFGLTVIAALALADGEPISALALAQKALEACVGHLLLHTQPVLVAVDALDALGRRAEADALVARAAAGVDARAERIADPELRASFLSTADRKRILARARGGQTSSS